MEWGGVELMVGFQGGSLLHFMEGGHRGKKHFHSTFILHGICTKKKIKFPK